MVTESVDPILFEKYDSNNLSFNNNLWKLKKLDYSVVRSISDRYGIPYITALLLFNRNVSIDFANSFIHPKLKYLMPDPFILSDMEKAVNRIIQALENNENIYIFGDYDVDGATSSALLYKFLKMIGYDEKKISIHISDRLSEGYGLNIKFIDKVYSENKYKLIITVDCGITSLKEVDFANEHNIDIVIIDHHQPEKEIPKAVAVVNPKKKNEIADFSYMAAVGVCFFTIYAIYIKLKNDNYYKKNLISEPDLLSLLDLVALGTVCDVVPVIGVNRAFINTGVQVIQKRSNIGIKSLCDISEIDTNITPYHLGFVLGPRINAGGRIGDSSVGVKLLCADNPITARNYSEQLDDYNTKRRDLEKLYLNEIYEKLNIEECINNKLIFITGKNWHTGVIGIIASKIKEKYNLPTFIISVNETTKLAQGSARSVYGINIGNIILKAKEAGILLKGGGHDMAAGFTYNTDNEKDFIKFLIKEIADQLNGKSIVNVLHIDTIINMSAINLEFARSVASLSPYGEQNPEPLFLITSARLVKIDIIKNEHIRCVFSNINNYSICTISFKSIDTYMGQILLKNIGKNFDILGKIRINSYKGSDSVSFLLEDAKFTS